MTRALQPCGTHAAYKRHRKNGEKPCSPCTRANADYMSAWTLRHVGNVPAHVHGTTNGYSNYGCRCPQCTDVWVVAHARTMDHALDARSRVAARARAVTGVVLR